MVKTYAIVDNENGNIVHNLRYFNKDLADAILRKYEDHHIEILKVSIFKTIRCYFYSLMLSIKYM